MAPTPGPNYPTNDTKKHQDRAEWEPQPLDRCRCRGVVKPRAREGAAILGASNGPRFRDGELIEEQFACRESLRMLGTFAA
ncbi:hypothetical protein AHiyo8_48500 [Arthrobacter sp. Hiyo8]|nr:hypothetical protein AHiyo8_48500 [Arthrobacter sp. Hiyo8]